MSSKQRRAEPLAAEDRRRAILQAVIPLLVDRGASVTTRQMAEAAGIAEGTIFGVFPDKCALIFEAVKVSIDPTPIQRQLSEIHPAAPIEVQLAEAARILLERFEVVISLLSILHTLPSSSQTHHSPGPPPFVAVANAAINQSLTKIFERHHDQLRIEPSRAAAAFRALILASGHPANDPAERLTVDEIVGVLLSGIASPNLERVT